MYICGYVYVLFVCSYFMPSHKVMATLRFCPTGRLSHSHYPNTRPTSLFLILIILSTWLRSNQYLIYCHWFDSTGCPARPKSPDLQQSEYMWRDLMRRSHCFFKKYIYFGCCKTQYEDEPPMQQTSNPRPFLPDVYLNC